MTVSAEKKELYKEKVKPFKEKVDELKKEIGKLKQEANKNERLRPFFTIKGSALSIAYANTLVLMSNLSETIQNIKSNQYLDQARKEISNSISDLNKVFGEQIDSGLTENQELLEQLQEIKPKHKLHFAQEIVSAIQRVKDALGETSKWRWSFPDMHYRFIIFAKNWFDFKLYERCKDPREEDYRPLQEYIEMLSSEAQNAAQEFRSRYELSTQEIASLYKIRSLFEMQKQVYILMNNKNELNRVQTSLDNISDMIENLIAKKDKKSEAK